MLAETGVGARVMGSVLNISLPWESTPRLPGDPFFPSMMQSLPALPMAAARAPARPLHLHSQKDARIPGWCYKWAEMRCSLSFSFLLSALMEIKSH
ncbi:hypothetical protein AAFF_G00093370 [Aldrovandia affinis]|uniref:Uncharacterized protein n=1 Tax=Aldrovandia affinis TaxID=143900 RepID=A0AAD7T2V0_9TELE|nr:hypothetical protein AAFF_G00093370 [Aldrovandia affinis]